MTNTISDETRALAVAALEYMRDDSRAIRLSHTAEEYDEIMRQVNAALADLAADAQAQAAQVWLPLLNGACHDANSRYGEELKVNGGRLDIYDYSLNTTGLPDMVFDLPDDLRLCRLMPAPVAQGVGVPLDFPDGPGWWAFKGRWGDQVKATSFCHVYEVYLMTDGKLWFGLNGKSYPVELMIGTWTKLTLPWDAPAPRTAGEVGDA